MTQRDVGPDMDPNGLTLWKVFLKVNFEKSQQTTQKAWKITKNVKSLMKQMEWN